VSELKDIVNDLFVGNAKVDTSVAQQCERWSKHEIKGEIAKIFQVLNLLPAHKKKLAETKFVYQYYTMCKKLFEYARYLEKPRKERKITPDLVHNFLNWKRAIKDLTTSWASDHAWIFAQSNIVKLESSAANSSAGPLERSFKRSQFSAGDVGYDWTFSTAAVPDMIDEVQRNADEVLADWLDDTHGLLKLLDKSVPSGWHLAKKEVMDDKHTELRSGSMLSLEVIRRVNNGTKLLQEWSGLFSTLNQSGHGILIGAEFCKEVSERYADAVAFVHFSAHCQQTLTQIPAVKNIMMRKRAASNYLGLHNQDELGKHLHDRLQAIAQGTWPPKTPGPSPASTGEDGKVDV